MEENIIEKKNTKNQQIAGAIIIAGVLIAGAILLKGNTAPRINNPTNNDVAPAKVSKEDKTLGNPQAKVTLILYEDFQCPFCGAISGLVSDTDAIRYLKQNVDPKWAPFMPYVNGRVKSGDLLFVYRDYAFLGPESIQSAEAARCAGDQNKFWEYHDYLYTHQNGENKGGFSDSNLKSFAKTLNLNSILFNKCLDENKYGQAVLDSRNEASKAGVNGTPKGFILKGKKIVSTIEGAESLSSVKPKIENALK